MLHHASLPQRELVARNPQGKGFQRLPHRWIVERTFGWLNRWRRLSKDYEHLTDTSECTIRVAMIYPPARAQITTTEAYLTRSKTKPKLSVSAW